MFPGLEQDEQGIIWPSHVVHTFLRYAFLISSVCLVRTSRQNAQASQLTFRGFRMHPQEVVERCISHHWTCIASDGIL